MWIVLKYKKNEQNFLFKELKEKIGNDIKIYIPKIQLKYFSKNLKYILKDFIQSQKEINLFVNRCGCYEDKEGFLTQDFFNFEKHNKFEFFSGPFTNMIFDLIKRENKFNLKCLIGNFKLTVTGKDNLFFPV